MDLNARSPVVRTFDSPILTFEWSKIRRVNIATENGIGMKYIVVFLSLHEISISLPAMTT